MQLLSLSLLLGNAACVASNVWPVPEAVMQHSVTTATTINAQGVVVPGKEQAMLLVTRFGTSDFAVLLWCLKCQLRLRGDVTRDTRAC
jgi:hypothetical protein